MTAVITSKRAAQGDGDCPECRRPLERGQRIVLVRHGGQHAWVHVRHLAEHQAHDEEPPGHDETGTCEAAEIASQLPTSSEGQERR